MLRSSVSSSRSLKPGVKRSAKKASSGIRRCIWRYSRAFWTLCPGAGFTVMGLDYSPIKGPEGNIEYLGYLRKGTHPAPELDPAAIVEQSHGALAHGKESGV